MYCALCFDTTDHLLDSGADVACSPQMLYWDVTKCFIVAVSDVCVLPFYVLQCVMCWDLLLSLRYC